MGSNITVGHVYNGGTCIQWWDMYIMVGHASRWSNDGEVGHASWWSNDGEVGPIAASIVLYCIVLYG